MAMKITRLAGLSLYYKVQDILSRSRSKEKAKSADFKTYNLKYSNVQAQYPVSVYINSSLADEASYQIDYNEGMIVFDTQLSSDDKVEVDYTFCPVHVYNESKNPLGDDFRYPAVALYEHKRRDKGYELGTNSKEKNPTWMFDVWCKRGGERDDITDTIMEIYEEGSLPIIDYNLGFPIDEDGNKNDSFDYDSQTIGFIFCNSINYSKGGSLDIGEKPAYLTEIIADLTITH